MTERNLKLWKQKYIGVLLLAEDKQQLERVVKFPKDWEKGL
jgi:hypothetical protein